MMNSISNQGQLGGALNSPWASNQKISPGVLTGSNGNGYADIERYAGRIQFEVEQVENGYLIKYADKPGGYMKTKIAANMDELKDLFVATLVNAKLGG